MGCSYKVNKEQKELEIEISGVTQLLCMKKSFTVPVTNIETPVVSHPEEPYTSSIFRLGTHLPYFYKAGTFWGLSNWQLQKKMFIYHQDSRRTIMFKLRNEDYRALILQVPDNVKDVEEEAENLTNLIESLQ